MLDRFEKSKLLRRMYWAGLGVIGAGVLLFGGAALITAIARF